LTHDRNCWSARAANRLASQAALAGLLSIAAGCAGTPSHVPSEWPPPDFRVQVEELHEGEGSSVASRRFTVTADGVCIYSRSTQPLVDPESHTAIPVFGTISAYQLCGECTRQLARLLHRRGVLALDQEQGDRRETKGVSLRLSYRAFENERIVVASGQVHGSFVGVLHVVNAYVPPGEEFTLPGMVGDPLPSNLIGVPAPAESVPGALAFHEQLLAQHPNDADLLLDTFALSCAARDRAKAEQLLSRWTAAADIGASAAAPFADPPRLLPDMLRRMLPN
jgi:hypothetical protein